MKHNAITVVITLSYFLVSPSLAFAAPPKVIKALPDNGDIGVDPNLKEIRITFDQPMAEGMSVVGGGETYPDAQGRPKWLNPRTIAIPVKLQPNHEYWISANNERFQNFMNRAGVPAVPYPIKFRTGAGNGAANGAAIGNEPGVGARKLTTKDNRRAVNLLRSAIRNHYSYRDRLKIDWDALFGQSESALIAAKTPVEFAQLAGNVLARAQDKHIWFQVGDQIIPSFVRPSVPNANYSLLPKLVPGLRKHGRAVVSGRWDDGIGYLAIATWDRSKLDDGKSVFDALDAVRDTQALVIDVRANGGGAEPLAQEIAGYFVSDRQLYGKHVYRDPKSPSGFSRTSERWLEPNPDRPHYSGRVAVLSGPAVMSSCESFLLMMKCVPGAVIVGATSQGSSGNPKPHDLRNGVTVLLPSWKDMTADGQEMEGVGVAPDIEVDRAPADFQTSDPVLEAALAHLRETKQ